MVMALLFKLLGDDTWQNPVRSKGLEYMPAAENKLVISNQLYQVMTVEPTGDSSYPEKTVNRNVRRQLSVQLEVVLRPRYNFFNKQL